MSQGGQITLKGDGRKHLGIHNQDDSVRMWLYKDKGGDGVRLNNGNDGGGDYIFHKDGGFRAPSSIYAGAARIASDGNIYGSMWGNQWLDAYLKKTFQPKGAYGKANTAKLGVNGWFKCGDTGLIIQWGKTDSENFDRKILPLPLPFPNEGLWALGWVAEAIGMGEDLCSHSAGLVDKAHIKVTTDYNLATARIAIGY
ncbi:hypothetical protein E05_50590 [Plautia stali symbiont]|nr:hypothetical protein E05_07050 [Plautia stali symbiont]BAN99825.1 hypothetical protein E05_50590 [Plautia stali symbiont]